MPVRLTLPSHWTLKPSSRAQSDQRGSPLPPTAYVGGDFTADLGSTNLVGTGLGEGKLSSLLGDAVSFALHDGIIFSLPPTL